MNHKPIKAFIFAAGRGERMGELTKNTPKPLLTIANKPLIAYTLENLAKAGIKDVVINLAHLGQKIENHIGDGYQYNVSVQYSREPYPLETGGAIFQALALLGDGPILMVNADVWTDFPFQALSAETLSSGDAAHLVMVQNPEQHQAGDFKITETNRLELKARGVEGVSATYSGIGLFDPALINDYPRCREKFPLREVFEHFIRLNKISAELYLGEWQDVGTPERLEQLNLRFS